MKRVQLSRKKGSRLPPNTRVCSRTTRFGNPFNWQCLYLHLNDPSKQKEFASRDFENWLDGQWPQLYPDERKWILEHEHELWQYDYLACWCPLDQCCHVDVYIKRYEAKNE